MAIAEVSRVETLIPQRKKKRIRSVLQKLLQKPEEKKLGKVSVSNIALHCFDFSLTTGR